MGIVFNRKIGLSYNNEVGCLKKVSHKPAFKLLRPHNIQLLKNLGLKVIAQRKKIKFFYICICIFIFIYQRLKICNGRANTKYFTFKEN